MNSDLNSDLNRNLNRNLNRALKILVIDELQERSSELCAGLVAAGYLVAATLSSTNDLADQVTRVAPDIILIDTDAPSRDTLEHLAIMEQNAPRPVVVFAKESDSTTIRQAISAGVAAYIVDGIDPARLQPVIDVALAQFESHQNLKNELANTTRQLSERKQIDRAKGLLMKQRGYDEETAYRTLRKLAMDRGQSMASVARDLVELASVLL